VLGDVWAETGKRWLNLWAQTDPIGAAIALRSPGARVDWQMLPDPLTLDVDPRTGEPVSVCDHSGYLSRPEYPPAVEFLRRMSAGEEYALARRDGGAVNGSCGYTLRLASGQLPGAGGAWSVTLYDKDDGLYRNPLMRFSLGSASERLITTNGGDVDVCVQRSPPPAARQLNWLPAPAGDFTLVLRVGWPHAVPPAGWAPPQLDVVAEPLAVRDAGA
jgi:hypothetical protein